MPMQYRPRECRPERRSPFYNPERDLGYIGVGLIRAGAIAQEERFWEPWYSAFLQETALTTDEIHAGLKKLAEATTRIVQDANPTLAMAAVGFDQLPPAIQVAVYCKLGQVLLAAVWKGTKDVKDFNSGTPPEVLELVEMVEDIVAPGAVVRTEAPSTPPSDR